MVRVCEKWFPIGTYKNQRSPGFYMDGYLKNQLDILIKNVTKDWDFTIIISGGGEVRVGKSVLGMQIACYWAYEMERVHGIKVPFSLDNFVLEWEKLIKQGHKMGQESHYCPLIYDEAGETLETGKVVTKETKEVMNYLRECGQYNFLNILILPDYFRLPIPIALTRSKCLLDVYYDTDDEGNFKRGFYKFYSSRQKKRLYLNGRKTLSYNAASHNFIGRFDNIYTIDEQKYRQLKNEAFAKRETQKLDKKAIKLIVALNILKHFYGLTVRQIRDLFNERGCPIGMGEISEATNENFLENEGRVPFHIRNKLITSCNLTTINK